MKTILPPQNYNFTEHAFKCIFDNIPYCKNILNKWGNTAKVIFRINLQKNGLPYLNTKKFCLDLSNISETDVKLEKCLNLVNYNKNINTNNYEKNIYVKYVQ